MQQKESLNYDFGKTSKLDVYTKKNYNLSFESKDRIY